MFVFMCLFILLFFVVCLFFILVYLLSTVGHNKEKFTSLESGFSSNLKKYKISFSMQFFLLMLIFLFFDLELLLLFSLLTNYSLWWSSLIILFVLSTFYLEIILGSLKWKLYMS